MPANASEDTLLSLMGKAYDAALDERKWPSFLEAFANAVGGSFSILRSVNYKEAKASFAASNRLRIRLAGAANDQGIAMGTATARTQLAAVFARTGAKGQAELLMMLAT